MARIAIVSQRLLGHLLPVVEIGKELHRRKHDVWVLSHLSHESYIRRERLKFIELGWDKFPDLFVQEMMETLIPIIEEMNFHIVLCDSSLAAPAYVSEMRGLIWVSFQTTVPLPDDKLSGNHLANNRRRSVYEKELNQSRAVYGLESLQDFKRTRGDLAGLSPFLHLVMVAPEMIINRESLPDATVIAGPCVYNESNLPICSADDDEITTVVVCTSSLERYDFRDATDKYVSACLEAFARDNYRLKISLSHPISTRDSYKNVDWVSEYPSHHKLLPGASVAITHGGCNTLHHCMYYAVPMIIIPLGADHLALGRRCEELGVALVLNPEDVGTENVFHRVQQILQEPNYKYRAREVAEQLRVHQSSVQLSASCIEDLIFKNRI